MRTLNEDGKNIPIGRNKAWIALAAFAFGCGLFVMAIMSIHYDSRLEAVQVAHGKNIATIEARHTREKNRIRKEVIEQLDRIERQAICTR